MRRSLLAAVAAAAMVALTAAPASAHASFPGASPYPSGSDQRLTMEVPEERGDSTHNVGVKVFTPTGWTALGCETSPSWHCELADESGLAVVRWTKVAGAAPGPGDETFVFTIRVGPPGKAAFPVHQTYTGGEVVRWIGQSDSEEPAPVLESVAATEPSSTTTAGSGPANTATTTPSTAPVAAPTTTHTTRTGPATSTTTTTSATAATPVPGPSDQSSSSIPGDPTTTSTVPLAQAPDEDSDGTSSGTVLLVGLVVSVIGAALVARNRRRG